MLIKCRYCENYYDTKQLARHLKAKHNVEYKEYVNKYWEDLPQFQSCEVCKKVIVYRKKTCSDKCYKIYQSRMSSGRKMPPRTKEYCEKISMSAKQRLKNPKNHPMYGKNQTEKSNQKNSITHKEMYKNGWKPRVGKNHTKESRANMSETALKRAQQSDYVNPMQGKTHTSEAIKKIFSHRKMNTIEKLVADKLTENNIEFYFQYFLIRNGTCKSYDFKIKGKKLFIEVDGDYWHGGPGHKYDYFKGVNEVKENDKFKDELATENGFEIIRLWESELKKNPNLVIEKLNDKIEKFNS